MLDNLERLTGGDKERMELYLSTFKEGIGEYIKLLKVAIADKNIENISYTIHVSKPLFTLVGLKNLYNKACDIENSIDSNKDLSEITEKASSLLSKMEISLEDLIDPNT